MPYASSNERAPTRRHSPVARRRATSRPLELVDGVRRALEAADDEADDLGVALQRGGDRPRLPRHVLHAPEGG